MKRQRKKLGLSEWAGRILFVSLALSVVFSVVRLIQAPSAIPEGEPFQKVKSDYMLMVLQCTLGLIVMLLPSAISRRWNLSIPNFIYVLYYVFLYCAVFLGEVFSFYYIVPHCSGRPGMRVHQFR